MLLQIPQRTIQGRLGGLGACEKIGLVRQQVRASDRHHTLGGDLRLRDPRRLFG